MKPLSQPFVDGENNVILCDYVYRVTGNNLLDVVAYAQSTHDEPIYLLPISGSSSGGAIFQHTPPEQGTVVGLYIEPVNHPQVGLGTLENCCQLMTNEIVIDTNQRQVFAGAAITLAQLNQALADKLGKHFQVLGADLTSYQYAQVGATFMTGGMGPQRRYFSDSVKQIALYDGEQIRAIGGNQLIGHAGSYGWTGLVMGVCCEYVCLPKNEFAFTVPVDSAPRSLARLLAHLSAYTRLTIENGKVQSNRGDNVVLGIEHVTCESMKPLVQSEMSSPIHSLASRLVEKCRLAKADGLVFINGYSHQNIDDFIYTLVDNNNDEGITIAGIDLTHTTTFQDPEQMRVVREAIPFAARTQQTKAKFIYKAHTDANIQLNPHNLQQTIEQFWQFNLDYVNKIKTFFSTTENICGEIIIYGHLNPVGIDPHNRITFTSDDEAMFQHARAHVEKLRDNFLIEIYQLCQQTQSQFIGGEKSACSDAEMFSAFGGAKNAPPAMANKYVKQLEQIKTAHPTFRWRALSDYRCA